MAYPAPTPHRTVTGKVEKQRAVVVVGIIGIGQSNKARGDSDPAQTTPNKKWEWSI
jgi:hypothetical protein